MTRLLLGILIVIIRPCAAVHSLPTLRIEAHHVISGRIRFGSIRFGSVFLSKSPFRFGSVWQMLFSGSVRYGLRFLDAFWLGSVRFGSVLRPVSAGSEIK